MLDSWGKRGDAQIWGQPPSPPVATYLGDMTVFILQMIIKEFGGTVAKSDARTDGQFKVNVDTNCPLFK